MAEERVVRWRCARRVRLNFAVYLFPLAFVSRVPVGAGGSRWITFFGESGPCARNVTITGQHNNRSRPVSENLYTLRCTLSNFPKKKKMSVSHEYTALRFSSNNRAPKQTQGKYLSKRIVRAQLLETFYFGIFITYDRACDGRTPRLGEENAQRSQKLRRVCFSFTSSSPRFDSRGKVQHTREIGVASCVCVCPCDPVTPCARYRKQLLFYLFTILFRELNFLSARIKFDFSVVPHATSFRSGQVSLQLFFPKNSKYYNFCNFSHLSL